MGNCERCNGFMYKSKFWDLKTSGTGFFQFVCVNCGAVVDDTIVSNKALTKLPLGARELKRERLRIRRGNALAFARKDKNQSVPPLRMDHH